jgi:hypothetical protein
MVRLSLGSFSRDRGARAGAGCLPSQSRHRIQQFRSKRRLLLVCLLSGYRAVVVSILCSMIFRVPYPPFLDNKEGKAEGILKGGEGPKGRKWTYLFTPSAKTTHDLASHAQWERRLRAGIGADYLWSSFTHFVYLPVQFSPRPSSILYSISSLNGGAIVVRGSERGWVEKWWKTVDKSKRDKAVRAVGISSR